MIHKRLILLVVLIGITAVLVACGAAEPEVVEVTRVVTETVTEEGEAVEVTRVVTEEPAAEESAVEEPMEEAAEEEMEAPAESIEEPPLATGSEGVGDEPPPPDTGEKVSVTRADTESAVADVSAVGEAEIARAEDVETAATPAPLPTATIGSEELDRAADEETVDTGLTLDQNSRLTAGEVDDNAEWDDYVQYLRSYQGASIIPVDVSERHQIWVQDNQGNPVLGAVIEAEVNGQLITRLRTHSNGRSLFFPRAYINSSEDILVNITVNNQIESFTIPAGTSQREWFVTHPGTDQTRQQAQLDVLFLIDATGSMSDEINELKENIRAISARIDALPSQPDVRFGMVTYRDHGDAYITQVTDFTPQVEDFASSLDLVTAGGGGDYPEDLNEALSQAVHRAEWRVEDTVSLIFLVADAPPHLDYDQQNHYGYEMLQAATRGIKIYPIASSGLDEQGEYIFRQLAQSTGGRFIFLTYGEEGPGSTGTETEFEVSDYTVSSLDDLVVKIVEEELAPLNR